MNFDNLIAIGKIVGTYGYQGWVRVMPLTDFPERLYQLEQIIVDLPRGQTMMRVLAVKPYKEGFLFNLDQITSKEIAQTYGQAALCVTEAEIFPLPEGYYYYFQLKGLEVYDQERGFLGELTDVLETGANDVYVVQSDRHGEVLVPAIKDVIIQVDLERQKMLVRLLPGLLPE